MCKLSLTLWYKQYQTKFSRRGVPVHCPIVRLSRILRRLRPPNEDVETSVVSEFEEDKDVLIDAGDKLVLDGFVSCVTKKNATTYQAVITKNDQQLTMPFATVAGLIELYLS
jgi:hypothetical protein